MVKRPLNSSMEKQPVPANNSPRGEDFVEVLNSGDSEPRREAMAKQPAPINDSSPGKEAPVNDSSRGEDFVEVLNSGDSEPQSEAMGKQPAPVDDLSLGKEDLVQAFGLLLISGDTEPQRPAPVNDSSRDEDFVEVLNSGDSEPQSEAMGKQPAPVDDLSLGEDFVEAQRDQCDTGSKQTATEERTEESKTANDSPRARLFPVASDVKYLKKRSFPWNSALPASQDDVVFPTTEETSETSEQFEARVIANVVRAAKRQKESNSIHENPAKWKELFRYANKLKQD